MTSLVARRHRDRQRVICGRPQCGGLLGWATDVGFAVPQHYVVCQDADGTYHEEPEGRGRRRRQGLRPEHHGQSLARWGAPGKYAINRAVPLPTRVRCPACGWLSSVTAEIADLYGDT